MTRKSVPGLETPKGRRHMFKEEDFTEDSWKELTAQQKAVKRYKSKTQGKAAQSKTQLLYLKSEKGKAAQRKADKVKNDKKKEAKAIAKKLGLL